MTITFTYTAGHPMDRAGYVKIVFRHMDDFGTPQFDNPEAPNYCTVSTASRTIDKPCFSGRFEIDTLQVKAGVDISEIGIEPIIRECEGLEIALQVYRLPDQQASNEFSFELPLGELKKGDNPIYIHAAQQDGHLAWSSPIYVVGK